MEIETGGAFHFLDAGACLVLIYLVYYMLITIEWIFKRCESSQSKIRL